jgi:hypothetical protein
VHVAKQAVMASYDGGWQAAAREVARRAGGHLDPDIGARFAANIEPVLGALEAPDMLAAARWPASRGPRSRFPWVTWIACARLSRASPI